MSLSPTSLAFWRQMLVLFTRLFLISHLDPDLPPCRSALFDILVLSDHLHGLTPRDGIPCSPLQVEIETVLIEDPFRIIATLWDDAPGLKDTSSRESWRNWRRRVARYLSWYAWWCSPLEARAVACFARRVPAGCVYAARVCTSGLSGGRGSVHCTGRGRRRRSIAADV